MLGESLRQHFLNSGIPDTVKGLQATSVAMSTAQREPSTALRDLSDSREAVAQIEAADNRLTNSLDNRAKAVNAPFREVRRHLPRLWIPLIAGAALLIGLFGVRHSKLAEFTSDRCNANPQPLRNRSHCPIRSKVTELNPDEMLHSDLKQHVT